MVKESRKYSKNNFRGDIRKVLLEGKVDFSNPFNLNSLSLLKRIVPYANKGNFGGVIKTSRAYCRNLERDKVYSSEDKNKYLVSLNKRLGKASKIAAKYLEKNKEDISKMKYDDIKKLLNYSKDIKSKISNEKVKGGLEKSLAILSMGSILVGIFFSFNGITGNVIFPGNSTFFSFGGFFLFILGIVGAFFYI